jgi:hypothetical protein
MVGIFMAIHLIVNGIIAAVVNEKANLNNKDGLQGGPVQRSFSAHTLVSAIVFLLILGIMKNPFPIGFLFKSLKQNLLSDGFYIISAPILAHLAVSITFSVISFIEKDVKKVQELSNIFNGVSTAVCLLIIGFCFISPETIKSMENKAKEIKDKAKEMKEGTPKENPVAATDTAAKAFGKRQRRRNPPKRRKKKY